MDPRAQATARHQQRHATRNLGLRFSARSERRGESRHLCALRDQRQQRIAVSGFGAGSDSRRNIGADKTKRRYSLGSDSCYTAARNDPNAMPFSAPEKIETGATRPTAFTARCAVARLAVLA